MATLSQEKIAEIQKCIDAGHTLKETATLCGCNEKTVRKYGTYLHKGHHVLTAEEIERFTSLYKSGLPVKEIARQIPCGVRVAYDYIKRMRESSGSGGIFDSSTVDRATRHYLLKERLGAKDLPQKDAIHGLVKECGLSVEEAEQIYEDWRHDYVRGLLKW